MIDLDIAVYDQFDLPPLSEYEVYIKNFGSDNTRQVSVKNYTIEQWIFHDTLSTALRIERGKKILVFVIGLHNSPS